MLNEKKELFYRLMILMIYCFTKEKNVDYHWWHLTFGADDKAGIVEIVSAMEYLIQHPEIKHGKIRVGFTPDEEIGRVPQIWCQKFGADWAEAMDGSQIENWIRKF